MELNNLTNTPGARKSSKRVGRGCGSGLGKTSGKGQKGQQSRKGHKHKLQFEGGQMPLVRRLPKRGFNNARFNDKALAVNVSDLEKKFEAGAEITIEALKKARVQDSRQRRAHQEVHRQGHQGFRFGEGQDRGCRRLHRLSVWQSKPAKRPATHVAGFFFSHLPFVSYFFSFCRCEMI